MEPINFNDNKVKFVQIERNARMFSIINKKKKTRKRERAFHSLLATIFVDLSTVFGS